MAVRLNPAHDAKTREKIQASQLINRLNKFVNGEVEMPPHAVTAALGLLKKVLPDLQAVQHSGDAANPVAITKIERTVVNASNRNG